MSALTFFESLFLALAIKLSLAWVLRTKTTIVRRVKFERIAYVLAALTSIHQLAAWSLLRASNHVFLLTLALLLGAAMVDGLALAKLGRLGRRRGFIYAGVCNSAVLFVFLVLEFHNLR